jgi:crotonobetainyl-CoA:carnitine CoA-transferase CaiB-like acyl-CoA transferase
MVALQDVKILDLTRVIPGTFCTMLLADFGAEVIKVESPAVTEFVGSARSPVGEENRRRAAFFAPNRNKKSIALDLKPEEGKEIFYRLARYADVIVEGFRPGVVKRLKIDYETICKINPQIVYCSLSGYGQDGPYASLPGHDINYIAMGGVLDLIGSKSGPPVIPLNLVADFAAAALYGALGICLALLARDRTGQGQFVDVSFLDGTVSLMNWFSFNYLFEGQTLRRGESWLNGAYPYYGVYKTKDEKYITIGCIEPHFWENLCRLVGKEEYIPYHFAPEHVAWGPQDGKWAEIRSFLEGVFLSKTRDEWFELLSRNDIPVGKVYSQDEVFTDPQVLFRRMVLDVEHPRLGKIRQIGIAPKLSRTPGKVRNLSPLLGEHTQEILQRLGYKEEDIEKLRKDGVIN